MPRLPLSTTDLERRLRMVEPRVRLVRERHFRKALHALIDAGEPIPLNPEIPLWVRTTQLRHLDALPMTLEQENAEELLFILDPNDWPIESVSEVVPLRLSWRLLVRAAIQKRLQSDPAILKTLLLDVRNLGLEIEDEIRVVLVTDHQIRSNATPEQCIARFVEWLTILRAFDPDQLAIHFPRFAQVVENDPTRLGHFAEFDRLVDPCCPEPGLPRQASDDPGPVRSVHAFPVGGNAAALDRADRAGRSGNHVRAAIDSIRAGRPDLATNWIRNGLVVRLARVLDWDEPTQKVWADQLITLVIPAAEGVWDPAARCLYDLQKIPVDLEAGLSRLDPIGWITSLGRSPLRRDLSRMKPVILAQHLRAARRHLARAAIAPIDRAQIDQAIGELVHRTDETIREEYTPIIRNALDGAGLVPTGEVERIAREKLIAELIDRIVERGFLRIGDLRDAIARNQVKMSDLASPGEWIHGDLLLRADAQLARDLEGVYHRGEIYLRTIHRGTSLAFATSPGRWISKYVLFPFLGAFLTVEFAKYLTFEGHKLYHWVRNLIPHQTDDEPIFNEMGEVFFGSLPEETPVESHAISVTPGSISATLILGFLFLGLLYWPQFRRTVGQLLRLTGRILHTAVIALPVMIWKSSWFRAIRHNRITRYLNRNFGAATLTSLSVLLVLLVLGSGPRQAIRISVGIFTIVALAVQTTSGRRIEDELAELVSDSWREVRSNLIPEIIAWTVWTFRALAGLFERALYAVDEWFRFRPGQGQGVFVGKVLLACLWFPIAYLIRFGFNLLLEPQINPVKHFPVVTVSHKLLLPLIGAVSDATGLSEGVAALIIGCIPGIFGFIVWELKENWRLYTANRQPGLPQVVIGHHGETIRGLLRPGFHSGTVPNMFRSGRRAFRKALRRGEPMARELWQQQHSEVIHSLEAFVTREAMPLMQKVAPSLQAGHIVLGVQSIRIEFLSPDGPPLAITLRHDQGLIHRRIEYPEWWLALPEVARQQIEVILEGLSDMSCVDPTGRSSMTWEQWAKRWENHPASPST